MTTTHTDQSQNQGQTIESRSDYASTSEGQWRYWSDELKGSLYTLRRWHRQADFIAARFLDERGGNAAVARGFDHPPGQSPTSLFRLNLFYSNVTTLLGILYGRVPKVDVSRRHDDANDDAGRVAALIMERLLNNDVQDNEAEYDSVLRATLQDRLVPGLGVARVRYDCTTCDMPVGTNPETGETITEKQIISERAPTDYFHWRDVLWSWSRTWDGVRWVAFRSYLNKDEFKKRFPNVNPDNVTFKQQKMTNDNPSDVPEMPEYTENWLRAEIWEIWDKATRKVRWVALSCHQILDEKDDPLGLDSFFPCPRFFIANASTSLFVPTPDYHLAADLYAEIDILQTRIAVITEAVRVVGLHDASTPEIGRMFKEGTDNQLIPVDKWAMFAEKGGLAGQIDWFPIKDVVDALINLRQLRDETIALLYQVTGMSDIMRGQLDNQYEGVGQSNLKTTFGSVRLQALQGQYATFATDLMKLKAEIVAKHFSVNTIVQQSNVPALFDDPELIGKALNMIKSPELKLKVKIKPEAMAQIDYAQQQGEAVDYLTALSEFLAAAAPLTAQEPATAPFLMQLLQWGLSKFRGADEIEGVIDQAVKAAQQAAAQPKPDPESQRLEAEAKLEEAKSQAQLAIIQAKTQGAIQQRQADLDADIKTKAFEHQTEMAQSVGEMQRDLAVIEAKARADAMATAIDTQANMMQQTHATETETRKDLVDHALELDTIAEEAKAAIAEATVQAALKPSNTSTEE